MSTSPDCLAVMLWSALKRAAHLEPGGRAIIEDEVVVSNADLAASVGSLAHEVRALVAPGSRVGVCMEPGASHHIVLLAVLVASCTYVPLDPAWSRKRIAYVCGDSNVELIIGNCDSLPSVLTISSNEVESVMAGSRAYQDIEALPYPSDVPVYVMYTSGTTGAPKGVETDWLALKNRLEWMQQLYRLGHTDVVAIKTSCGFDVSMWEHLWPRLHGATAAALSVGKLGGWSSLYQAMADHQVTVSHFVPSVARAMLDDPGVGSMPSLRFVALSGEILDRTTAIGVQQMAPSAAVYNLYGPTECAIDVSYWHFKGEDPWDPVPIGQAAPNCSLTLTRTQDASQVGAPEDGELIISGCQVAKGYVGAAYGTGGFVDIAGGGTNYRTGDLARYVQPGVLSVIGRIDRQVKINGIRVELDGLESILRRHQLVSDCALLADKSDAGTSKIVVAYVPATNGHQLSSRELGKFVRSTSAMEAPLLHVRAIDQIPLTASGKTDYTTLRQSIGMEAKK